MPQCQLGTDYSIGKIVSGEFIFERTIGLSNDYKRLQVRKLTTPSKDPNAPYTIECELDISANRVDFRVSADYNLQFFQASTNIPSLVAQMYFTEISVPDPVKAALGLYWAEGELNPLRVIGVEDIRIGLQSGVINMPAINGFYVSRIEWANNQTFIQLEAWGPAPI